MCGMIQGSEHTLAKNLFILWLAYSFTLAMIILSIYILYMTDRHREGSVILNDQTNRKNSSGCNGLLLEIGFDFNTLISWSSATDIT